jgi:hypothetical protein
MSDGGQSADLWGTTHVDYLAMAEVLGATRTIEKPLKYSRLVGLVEECLAS